MKGKREGIIFGDSKASTWPGHQDEQMDSEEDEFTPIPAYNQRKGRKGKGKASGVNIKGKAHLSERSKNVAFEWCGFSQDALVPLWIEYGI